MKKFNALVAVATLATSGAGSVDAAAVADGQTRSETVRFADLNTANLEGAAALYNRIRNAAQRVCEYPENAQEYSVSRLDARCLHVAISDAVAKVGRPMVTAYAAGRGRGAGGWESPKVTPNH